MIIVKKVIKLICIIITVVLISMIIIGVLSGIGLFVALSVKKCTNLNDRTYSTIEELHQEYKTVCYSDVDIDHYPDEIVQTIQYEDFIFVVCTEKISNGSKVEDELLIYAVKPTNDGYILEVPYWGVSAIPRAHLQLGEDYSSFDYHYMDLQYVTENDSVCFGFMYKSADDTREFYFDGIEMSEVKCVNPFTGEEFILCYASSDKTYNVIESIMTPKDERHTLEIK